MEGAGNAEVLRLLSSRFAGRKTALRMIALDVGLFNAALKRCSTQDQADLHITSTGDSTVSLSI